MSRAAVIPLGVTKEIRALFPTWAASAAAMVAAAILGGSNLYAAGLLAFVLGTVALGALSIGHEYTNHTLTLFLSLPADRRRLFLVKLGVLAPMLLTLGAIAMGILFTPLARDPAFLRNGAFPLLLVLCGLFLAPWLTMVCRTPLAGGVFSLVILGMMHLFGEVLAVTRYGFSPGIRADAEHFKLAVVWWGVLGVCAFAAVSGWRLFMRLEAIEGPDQDVRLPRWLRDRTTTNLAAPGVARDRHPVWLLAKKELRLQQLTFVFAGLYVAGWVTVSLLRLVVPGFMGSLLTIFSGLYSVAVALVSGSLASAEERQFGTLESQVLLPMATWKQWTVKAGMTIGLAVLLAVGLPALLGFIDPTIDTRRLNAWDAGMVIVLTAGSLYVSSLCTSGIHALLLSLPVMLVVVMWLEFCAATAYRFHGTLNIARLRSLNVWLAPALAAVFVAVALWFALVNHRSSEHGGSRMWRQAIWMVGGLTLGMSIVTVVMTLSW